MRLHTLLQGQPELINDSLPDIEVAALITDSRQVVPGALFVALRGTTFDGHDFISDAVSQGAVAIMGEEPDQSLGIPYIRVPNSREALAKLAATWHGNPSRNLVVIGVTGTDGKTTTANILYQILQEADLRVGMITTVNVVIGEKTLDTGLHVTTPDSLEVQMYLAQMVSEGITHCVLEATSHGLAQHRVAACNFDLAVVTNITHDHLDYHESQEAYRDAKGMLFTWLEHSIIKPGGPIKTAILNRDDSSYEFLNRITSVRQISYGISQGADVVGDGVVADLEGLSFLIHGREYSVQVRCGLIGAYNVENCLAAFSAAVHGLGISPEVAVGGIAKLKRIPGRMEVIDVGQSFTAIVDFAHTPNSLRRALETARSLTEGKVIAVFGSAGLRDREKRRMMAEISTNLADLTVFTAEDPRTESLDAILEEMAAGAKSHGGSEGTTFVRILDRSEALRYAVRQAQPGGLVISCGKGHEQSMCFGELEYPWDDRIAFQAALTEYLGVEGPEMPQLPTGSKSS
jgi:UDP-N-acetylmuramoyl-L-alanyl-D-glutamate--2,6-diaminopimelate ligase